MFALDLLNQFQSYNGTLLAAGKIYVYHLGRTHLAPVYGDHNGATVLPNPVILDDQGMAEIYLNDAFNYTVVICDAYGAEQFSRDVYPKGMGNGESIGTQLYEGIDPIVVNNDVYAISANTSRLGVVTPLYFVKDDEEETIIGFSGEVIPEGVMTESALGFENNKITGYNGSAFSAGNEYEAGANIDIIDGVISGKDWTNEINDASANAYSQSTAWTNSQNYLTGVDLSEYAKTDFVVSSIDAATSGKYDTSSFSAISGSFLTALPPDVVYSADITGLATTAQLNEKLDKADSANFLLTGDSGNFYPMESNPSGYITAHQSLPQSANWNNTTNVVSSNSAQWGASNPQIPVTSTSGISIFESGDKVYFNISADYAFNSDLQNISAEITGMIPAPFDPAYLSGQIDNKLNSAIYANDSGSFATTGDINDLVTSIAETYQPKLTFDYNEDSAISAINGSALAGQGGSITGDYVSGVNLVKVPYWEGATEGNYYSANISGDVVVAFGDYRDDNYYPGRTISLSSMYNALDNKLDQSTVQNSNTLKYNYRTVESNGLSYKATGFGVVSATYVHLDINEYDGFRYLAVEYNSPVSEPGGLYSAIITIAGSAFGTTYNLEEQSWHLLNSGDGSATFYKNMYNAEHDSTFYIDGDRDWYITACDASATYYSGTELAPIAFKDDITGITYTTGSI